MRSAQILAEFVAGRIRQPKSVQRQIGTGRRRGCDGSERHWHSWQLAPGADQGNVVIERAQPKIRVNRY